MHRPASFMRRLSLRGLAGAATLAAVVGLSGLTGCASAPPPAGDPALLQHLDTVLRQANPQRPVSLRLTPEQVTTGNPLKVDLASSAGGYVYLFQLSTDGKRLTMLFPNAVDGTNHLGAGQRMALPRADWRMTARGPAGVGYVLAVLSEAPQDLLVLQTGLAAGRLDLRAPYGASMVSVREVAP